MRKRIALVVFTIVALIALAAPANGSSCPAPDWQYDACRKALGQPCPLCPGDPVPTDTSTSTSAPNTTVVPTSAAPAHAPAARTQPRFTG